MSGDEGSAARDPSRPDPAATPDPAPRDLIDRLLEEPVEPPPEASTRRTAHADPQPRPGGPTIPTRATFIVSEGWDTDRTIRPGGGGGDTGAGAGISPAGRLASAMPAVRHVARLALFALAIVGGAAGLVVAWFHVTSDPLADAHAYYDAAARLNAGQPLYPASIDPSTNLAYLYPPLLAIVLRPLALLGYEAFALIWEAVVLACFVLLLRRLGVRSQRTWLAIGLLGVPIGWALSIAQAHVPLTLLLAIGQPWSVALAANLKLFPAFVVLWWIGRRDGQAVAAFLGWSTLLVLVQVVLDPSGVVDYLKTVGLGQLGEVRNFSPFVVSPLLWVVLLAVGIAAAVVLARSRWGWPVAVALATLSPPRLLLYMLTSLLAAIREPVQANLPPPEPRPWTHVTGSGRH